jgi:hypothetical protein
MTINSLESIVFENRASKSAEYPRLHMKEPETFKFTKIRNFTTVEKEIHLSINYHRGRSQRSGSDSWVLDIYTYKGKNCNGKPKIFSSLQEIKDYIREKYKKEPIFPEGVI